MTPPLERSQASEAKGPFLAQLGESLEHTRMTLRLVWRSSRAMTVALAALTLVGALVPLGVAYVGKRIVDAVVAHARDATVHWVLVELALVAVQATVQRGLALIRNLLGARLGVDINVTILEKALGLDLKHFEDPEFYDKLTRARREASSRPIALVTESFGLVQSLITLAGYAALLVRFSGWSVLALFAATVPATLAEMRFSKLVFKIRNWRSPESRRLLYLEYVLANDEHAKEVKLFGLGPLLLERYKKTSEAFYEEDRGLYIRRSKWTHALSLVGTAAFYGAYAAMAVLASAGKLTLGDMTMYVVAFRQGQQAFQSALAAIGSMYEHNLYMSNLWEYLRVAGQAARPAGLPVGGTAIEAEPLSPGDGSMLATPVQGEGPRGIVLEDVGYRYPGKDARKEARAEARTDTRTDTRTGAPAEAPTGAPTGRWALRHVSLVIPAGESLALVGENGAGKTTLVKLLTRLYDPTEGRILLDGRDLRDWDVDQLRGRFGVLFQDYNQYQLKVRENVGFGSVDHMGDEPRIERAVDRGGASDVVVGLSGGLDAPLGRWFQDGTELSGGQWQKIALSRSFMREEADILVLDEPTAALDAEAEHAVFERFRALAQNRTTIVISHRFPTVRMARTIVVLEQGHIVEQGTHDDLLAHKGKYAHMFELQAQGYR